MKKISILILLLFSLQGCVVFPLDTENVDRSLYWCPPLHNCVSTESVTFVHSIQPFELNMPLDEAWPLIRSSVVELGHTSIQHEYSGYIYATSYTPVFHFLDFFEVLLVPSENRLNVRSSSLLGLTDLFTNYRRAERFREALEDKGVVKLK